MALLATLGTGLLVAGCDAQDSRREGSGAQASPTADSPGAPVALALPLDGYMLDEFEGHKLSELMRERTTACMKEFGHASFSLPPIPQPAVSVHNERRYGITDAKLAAHRGYRVRAENEKSTPEKDLMPAESFTLNGGSSVPGELGSGGKDQNGRTVPPGGCAGRAKEALGYKASDTPGNPQIIQNLDQESFGKSLEDGRVKAALSKWSECMRESGFNYPAEPFSASNDPAFAGPAVGEKEKNVAVADVRCKNSSRLLVEWKAVETSLQEKMIADRSSEIERIKTQTAAVRANIQRLAP
ncbi:hypothetical protein [Streptomyces toxytricini]|uniref:hypothetical protein n=1 Tax=Streptomyces toxytricini TaxID=67369 RepID=UPI00343FA348